jgi:lipoprotein-anchoring transpeptidase ErfK/SrfK
MKSFKYSLIIAIFAFLLAAPALAFPEDNFSNLLSGKILLDVDNQGEAWYVYPGDFHRYYLGSPADAYGVMSNLSLGISNADFSKIGSSTPDRFRGLILLKPEDSGRAYYVNPADKSLIFLPDASGALDLMRRFSLGITHKDLQTIPIGKIILDKSGRQLERTWEYLGWWGRVNQAYAPVMAEPGADSKRSGTLFLDNKIKVLRLVKNAGRIWYQIDGGQYPGAYIDSASVSAIAQPTPETKTIRPLAVKAGDYWVDVNITKKVLTLYKYDQAVMATYIAIGVKETPTIIGTYNVWFKVKKIRMKGDPPVATHSYDLADVPWVMFYKGSYSIHGTYWHDAFGTQRSAGCTNVTQGDAKYIFDLTDPKMGNLDSVFSTPENPGMLIYNHY